VNRSLSKVGAKGMMSEEPVRDRTGSFWLRSAELRTSYELRTLSRVAGISQFISVSFSSPNQNCTGADTWRNK